MSLKRSLSLPHVIFYGVGTILGAGVYVLVGKVAAQAGIFAPVAFLLAGILAAFSAFSYAELSSRFPHSSGAAGYIYQGTKQSWLSVLFGLGIALSGIVSASVLTLGFVGYFQVFFAVPEPIIIIELILVLTFLALWGIKDSVAVISVITLLEVFGLLLILWVAKGSFIEVPSYVVETLPTFAMADMVGLLGGMFLAFYAFIGFEDMVNVAEETKNPSKTLPKAIVFSLIFTGILYFLIALATLLSVPVGELANSDAPLALVYETYTNQSPIVITVISLFAVINGVIAQIIMASRILYGMGQKGWIAPVFGTTWKKRQTPAAATITVSVIILLFALAVDIVPLATATSFITLTLFALVNLSLILVKKRNPKKSKKFFNIPMWVPVIGFILNLLVLAQKVYLWIGV